MKLESTAAAPPPLPVVNIAAYRFASLEGLPALRAELLAFCRTHQLRGTILLSTEGINLFVAGKEPGIDALLARLRSLPGLAQLEAKYSHTAHQPFRRMLVRIKKEIIAFGVPGIEPARRHLDLPLDKQPVFTRWRVPRDPDFDPVRELPPFAGL